MADILRPLDEVQIHGEVSLSLSQYDTIMEEVVRGTRWSRNSRRVFHFITRHSVDQGENTIHLDLVRVGSRKQMLDGQHRLSVSLAQEWLPNSSSGRVISQRRAREISERISAILTKLGSQSPPSDLVCHVDWMFGEDEVDPIFPVPFPMSPMLSSPDLGMSMIRGLRISNEDATRSATIDRLPNGTLIVSTTLPLPNAKIGMEAIDTAISEASVVLDGLVHRRPIEGR